MQIPGIVHNGVVVPKEPLEVAEGTPVTIEIAGRADGKITPPIPPRQGGWLKGKINIAPDFDDLPDEIGEAFGMN